MGWGASPGSPTEWGTAPGMVLGFNPTVITPLRTWKENNESTCDCSVRVHAEFTRTPPTPTGKASPRAWVPHCPGLGFSAPRGPGQVDLPLTHTHACVCVLPAVFLNGISEVPLKYSAVRLKIIPWNGGNPALRVPCLVRAGHVPGFHPGAQEDGARAGAGQRSGSAGAPPGGGGAQLPCFTAVGMGDQSGSRWKRVTGGMPAHLAEAGPGERHGAG